MRTRVSAAVPCCLLALLSLPARADDINVAPGPNAIAQALAKAKDGDVLKLAAGQYTESIRIPAGVTLEGAAHATTTLTAAGHTAIECAGAHVRIVGLTIKPSETSVRGVAASLPVRIERCRFLGLREGVVLTTAPLSDIVACEFLDCAFGVRAIHEASPTIWGCCFQGGITGVSAEDGSPYIRNNLFNSLRQGIWLAPHAVQPAIIRNNIFANCTTAGIELMHGDKSLLGPSIRNQVFSNCGAAVVAPKSLVGSVSHALLFNTHAPAFHDDNGAETLHPGDANLTEGDPGLAISPDLSVTVAHPELLDTKGIRLCSDKPDATGTLGLEKDRRRVGIGATAPLPPARVGGKLLIANSIREEYQYLQVLNRARGMQGLGNRNGISVDSHTPGDGKEPKEIVFDISRFFNEQFLK